ncbi:MAG: hypothetical protein Q9175_008359 [Cornicularia normoerica]
MLPDLGDTLHLSHTCHLLRAVFTDHRKNIERGIIASTPVYQNDLGVTNFLNAYESVADTYRKHGNRLRKEDELNPAIFKECLNVD